MLLFEYCGLRTASGKLTPSLSPADSGFGKDAEKRKWGAQQPPHPGRLLRMDEGKHEGHAQARDQCESYYYCQRAEKRAAAAGGGAARG